MESSLCQEETGEHLANYDKLLYSPLYQQIKFKEVNNLWRDQASNVAAVGILAGVLNFKVHVLSIAIQPIQSTHMLPL